MKYLVFLILLFGAWQCHSQQKSTWKQFIDDKKTTAKSVNQKSFYLIEIEESDRFKSSQNTNLQIERVLDKHHFIVSSTHVDLETISGLSSIYNANNHWKTEIDLTDEKHSTFLVKGKSVDSLKLHLSKIPEVTILNEFRNNLIIQTETAVIKKQLLNHPLVTYIGEENLNPILESIVSDADLTVNNIRYTNHVESNILGEGLTISIKDELFDENDLDLLNKKIAQTENEPAIGKHATDMATITSGLGNSAITSLGAAPASNIASSNFNELPPDLNTYFSSNEIWIQNHSYGTEIENFYGALASSYDAQCEELPELLHVFSAGNKGADIPNEGPYKNLGAFANLTGNFKNAKNVLTVGACNYNDEVIEISSKGPAPDGRVKPELVAYSSFGTSNAAAIVSGATLLLQEKYLQLYNSKLPSYLAKAFLINGATDIEQKGPDYKSGFGKLDLYESISQLNQQHFILGEIIPNETKSFVVNVPQGVQDLKITLVWLDPPANPNDNIALVNNLDLSVSSPSNGISLPLVLDKSPSEDMLSKTAQQGIDAINNVEQVIIDTPEVGDYTFTIKSTNQSTPSQKFAIVYHYQENNVFEWQYPTATSNVPYNGESLANFKWKSTIPEDKGTLEISFDNGETWQLIEENIDLTKGSYLFSDLPKTNSSAKIKITTVANSYESESFPYSFSPRARVTLNCNSTKQVSWNKLKDVDTYQLYTLDMDKMEPFTTVSDTSYALSASEKEINYFAVAPILNDGSVGARSETIILEASEDIYYINNFIANANETSAAINIFTNLNSTLNIEQAIIYALRGNERIPLTNLNTNIANGFVYEDIDPIQGVNRYQLEIKLTSGDIILSEVATAVFLTDTPFYIFPNPTTDGINIYTKEFDSEQVTFYLFNMSGSLIFTAPVTSDRAYITFNNPAPGVYIAKIKASSGEESIKKIVIK
ncbi:S8 family peptidase [Galbibacter sp. BG1]|uniref:S8 family serine peptidase n=1 Tax=Galbibacter sp. BG1 TaxID=1170699 RepID=UPI0015BEF2B3|nr:S8 family serine peptidase [Galbibacter sp. BG1]QLE01827.1 S8 family peptidase [Galbibacter sp. BG1]